ncbi:MULTISPECIES: hypothetical protein [unclassified Streptomyces]|uniref:hypothetical protein n=1 Tax=unclassified Streptomyces TaxID=2593676 RepID=UPI00378EB4BA
MDATDLGHRARRRSGCIPPKLVSRLLERGYADLLEGWGRVDEAIEITRVRREIGHPMALESYARLPF